MVDMIWSMTTVMLLWLAMLTWIIRDWGPIDPAEKAVTVGQWVFKTPKLDRQVEKWLGEVDRP